MSIYLGIDTSNYTTSVAAAGDKTINLRRIIDVGEGMRGIRQSDGVFVHLKTLPELFEQLDVNMNGVKAIGVSTRPRNKSGSYMPVFVAGHSFARVVSKTLGVPLYEFSHQDGHIMAGIMSGSYEELMNEPFCAVHLSGGTTEILNCRYNGHGFDTDIIGATLDISAGQLIDRLGVKLGMRFPCGAELDSAAMSTERYVRLKTSVKGGYINFSGLENRLNDMDEEACVKARSAFSAIGESLVKVLNFYKVKRVLFVGGVSASRFLRGYLAENINAQIYFAQGGLSSDNAVGIAGLAERKER